jgi:8-oxo-dGTP pyrophosphatase MutT (NUDIX family)
MTALVGLSSCALGVATVWEIGPLGSLFG